MEKIINVQIFFGEELIGSCHYIVLNPHSLTFERTFTFKEIAVLKDIEFRFEDTIHVQIHFTDAYGGAEPYTEFSIIIDGIRKFISGQDFEVSGYVVISQYQRYDQRIIDIFNKWQNDEPIDWWQLSTDYKEMYIVCCRYWSGFIERLTRDYYHIDCTLVKEKIDFYYLISKEFVGNRGYFGRDLDQFTDCLLTSLDRSASVGYVTIELKGHIQLVSVLGLDQFNYIYEDLKKYRFNVILS